MTAAVLFDLDDTLFLQEEWLAGAWDAVAAAARTAAPLVDVAQLRRMLGLIAAEGSDRGRIIDRAVAGCGYTGLDIQPLVAAFRAHAPARLTPLPGVPAALARLCRLLPVGLVTDGDPSIQRAKLNALGLAGAFDVIVISDELGREFRKPHRLPFLRAAAALGADPESVTYIGDRPDKDVAGATGAGMRAIRVRTGEYSEAPDVPEPWKSTRDAIEAISVVMFELSTPAPAAALD